MSSQKAEAKIWWLLLATFTAVLVQPELAQAQLLPPILLGIIPHFPGLFPQESTPTPLECWSTLLNVPGCVGEIFMSIFSAQFDSIGYDCCKAFSTINQNCWPKIFPDDPSFPPLLKDHCARS